MKYRVVSKVAAVACAGALAVGALTGCMPQGSNPEAEAQAANRQYMTQVNQRMEALHEQLAEFADAVARGDAVSMRTLADSAYKTIDELEAAEAPEALADVKAGYAEGCAALEEALNGYIDLSVQAASLDAAAYNERLADVQARYDEGVAKLAEADEAAANLPQ